VDRRTPEAEEQSSARVTTLTLAWRRRNPPSSNVKKEDLSSDTERQQPRFTQGVFLLRQIRYLTHRNCWISIRDPLGLGGFLLEAIIIGTAAGWIFYRIPPTLTGIRAMQGFIYSVLGLQGYILLLFTIYKVSVDMKVLQS
jgi:hypothetical protein